MNTHLKRIVSPISFPRLLDDFLTISANNYPEKAALICIDRRITYKSLEETTSQLANFLNANGIGRNERVIILLDNSIEVVISLFGILRNDSVFIILSSSTKPRNLSYILQDSAASLIITDTKRKEIVREVFSDEKIKSRVLWIGNKEDVDDLPGEKFLYWDTIAKYDVEISKTRKNIDTDLAAFIYTSGTTGRSKGIMCTHKSMVAAATSIIQYLENKPEDIILSVLPLSFDYGLYQVLMSIIFGGTVIIENGFLFINDILKIIEKYRVTGFPIVPTILTMMLNLKNISKYDFSSLRYMTNTGAALPVEHIKRMRMQFNHVKFYSMYGLSECKRVSYLPPDEIDKRPGSVGKAIPNCEVFVVDENNKKVKPGEIGELVVRGSNLMSGYWNDPELTWKKFRNAADGNDKWLYTGDYFKQDEDGYLYFIGRKDEMIKCKGERVSPKEIEETICILSSVAEAAVIGVDDIVLGQAIKAFVVPVNGIEISPSEISKHCACSLEDFKTPKYIEIVFELPRNSNGKVDKKSLLLQSKESI